MLIWDDMSGSDKIKIYNSRIERDVNSQDLRILYHLGEGRIPSIVPGEAIKRELDFISLSLKNGRIGLDSIIGESHILRVGKTLSALKQSLVANGEKIWI
jgi:hypothetical protein